MSALNGSCFVDLPSSCEYHAMKNDRAGRDDESETKQKLLASEDNEFYVNGKYPKRVKIDLGDQGSEDISIAFDGQWPLIRFLGECKAKLTSKFVHLLGEDWLLLIMMGSIMGIFSFVIDVSIQKLRALHFHMFHELAQIHPFLQYFIWVAFTLALVLLAASSCYFISPQAVGSGIPEMKTILRGVVLKEYLTLKTLVAKCIGLVLALGSGLPFGKEGPFVHIASMAAILLRRFVVSFEGAYENESRSSEMLAAACAVGVASTYGAPIGGVLFSIEVTSVFFPLRNYWRGFFAAVCSAIIFRLLAVISNEMDTLVAFSSTNLPSNFPYDPKEMIVFALMGITCGLFAAAFIAFHRRYLQLLRETGWIKKIFDKGYFIYPTVVVFVIASLKCPLGYGEFFAGGLTPREALDELFCNFSWNDPIVMNSSYGAVLMDHWSGEKTSIFLVLALYALNMFWMTAVANTLPVPCGIFIPVFVAGAAFGRICGEAMAILFPTGLRADGLTKIIPGAYAIVGATAFAGGITHAISSSVIVLEITGQMRYVLPCMLSVLLSIAVCSHFQPSIYDSIIRIKKLPYLPRIPPTSSAIHNITVSNIMIRRVHYVSLETTFRQLRYVLEKKPRLRAFPLVDRPSSLILLGSIARSQLEKALDDHIGDDLWCLEHFRRRSKSSAGTLLNTKLNSTATFSGDRAKMLGMKLKSELMRKAKSDEELHQVTLSITPDRLRHKSGPESNNGKYTARLSTPSLKRAKAWETRVSAVGSYVSSLSNRLRQSLGFQLTASGSHSLNSEDFHSDERREWEEARLNDCVDFEELTLDPAPFQLVECTSLYKVHALFSLLGLNRAYVTCLGRLVGVVALRELRAALERAQNGQDPKAPTCVDSKGSSESSSSADNSIPGTSLNATVVTPADVVRKISGHVAPTFFLDHPLAAPAPAQSTGLDTMNPSRDRLAPPQRSADQQQERNNVIDEGDDTFRNGPKDYFYVEPPRRVSLNSGEIA